MIWLWCLLYMFWINQVETELWPLLSFWNFKSILKLLRYFLMASSLLFFSVCLQISNIFPISSHRTLLLVTRTTLPTRYSNICILFLKNYDLFPKFFKYLLRVFLYFQFNFLLVVKPFKNPPKYIYIVPTRYALFICSLRRASSLWASIANMYFPNYFFCSFRNARYYLILCWTLIVFSPAYETLFTNILRVLRMCMTDA